MTIDFDFQPTLEGARVIVRPIAPTDWPSMYAAASDPEIWIQHPAPDRYKEDVFRAYFDGAIQSGSAFTFVDRESGKVIGSSRYHGLDSTAREIEIGWTFLTRDFWGGSFNLEIKRLMLDHAFLFVDTVVFWVGETNLRSRCAMARIGGVLRDGVHFRETTAEHADVIYEIRKALWKQTGSSVPGTD
ncbi:MAG: GNAT family N-acetyltransferase [Woeseiaceae bacterium]